MTIRGLLTGLAVVVALLVTPGSPASADDDSSLSVQIDGLSPSRLSDDATIRMSGVIRNTGSTPWTAVQAYLVIPRSPFTSRTQIDDAIEDGQSYTGDRVVDAGRFDEVGSLAPGAFVRFSLRVPTKDLGLVAGGVYPVGVQILATDAEGVRSNDAVARATTFLPWVENPSQPVATGLVWPFTATWDAADTDWTAVAESLTSGQLRHYLDAALTTPRAGRTIILDPSILDELDPFADPENPPDGVTGAQAEAIGGWLDDLRGLALGSTTWIVDYARPDDLAFTRSPTHAGELWSRVDDATADSLATHELTGSRASWPTRTGVTREVLELIRSRDESPTLVSRGVVPDWEPRLGSVVNVPTRNGPLPLVVNGSLPDIPGAETAVTVRQRLLTDAALADLSRSSDRRSRADALTVLDPNWDPGPGAGAVLTPALTTAGSGGLTAPTTAADLLRSSPADYTGDIASDVETRSLSTAYLDRVALLSQATAVLTDLRVADEKPSFDREIAADVSVRWRPDESEATTRVGRRLDLVRSELSSVTIDSPSTITLSSRRGGFPLTIANDTEYSIRVGLDLTADNPSLDLDDIDPIEIDAGERHTLTVEVDLGDQSSSTVTARLATAAGDTFGDPAVFNIRSSNVGLFVWLAMAGAGLLVVATWARRFLGSRRRRRE